MIPMTMSKLRMRCPGGSSFMTEYPLNDEHIKLYVTDLTRSMLDTISCLHDHVADIAASGIMGPDEHEYITYRLKELKDDAHEAWFVGYAHCGMVVGFRFPFGRGHIAIIRRAIAFSLNPARDGVLRFLHGTEHAGDEK